MTSCPAELVEVPACVGPTHRGTTAGGSVTRAVAVVGQPAARRLLPDFAVFLFIERISGASFITLRQVPEKIVECLSPLNLTGQFDCRESN